MTMKKEILNVLEIESIRKLAKEERQKLGFAEDIPIANDIDTILEKLNIILLEYPIIENGERQAFSAVMMYIEEDDIEYSFIGLNTADYYDKQIFALAHELYHFYMKTGSHLSRLCVTTKDNIEVKANRFAAELLLPGYMLKSIVLNDFQKTDLKKLNTKKILRFIARMQCTWWLPYRSLVRRLKELEFISEVQYKELYGINEREKNGEYWQIGNAINNEVFNKLNTITNSIGTLPKHIEIIISNFEDELISEDKFSDVLTLFNKTPSDFGYESKASQEDIDEFSEIFGKEHDE